MKGIDEDKVPVTIESEANQPTSELKIFSMNLHSGLKLWCHNPTEQTLEEVIYKDVALDTTDGSLRYKVMFVPGCRYVQALNIKNALRKLKLVPKDTEWKKNTTSSQ